MKYEFKLVQEIAWGMAVGAGIFVFELLSQFDEGVFSNWESWSRAAVAGLLRAASAGGLNAIRRLMSG